MLQRTTPPVRLRRTTSPCTGEAVALTSLGINLGAPSGGSWHGASRGGEGVSAAARHNAGGQSRPPLRRSARVADFIPFVIARRAIARRGNPFLLYLPPAGYFLPTAAKSTQKTPPKPMVLESFTLQERVSYRIKTCMRLMHIPAAAPGRLKLSAGDERKVPPLFVGADDSVRPRRNGLPRWAAPSPA